MGREPALVRMQPRAARRQRSGTLAIRREGSIGQLCRRGVTLGGARPSFAAFERDGGQEICGRNGDLEGPFGRKRYTGRGAAGKEQDARQWHAGHNPCYTENVREF